MAVDCKAQKKDEYMYAKSGDKCHNNVGIVDIRKKFSYLFRAGKKSLAAGDQKKQEKT